MAEPVLTVTPEARPARPGKPFTIVCEVTWPGSPDEYVILPAEVSPVDWATVEVVEARSFIRDGENVVAFTLTLNPKAKGEYQTPEITVGFLNPEDIKESEQPKDPGNPAQAGAPTAPDAIPRLRAAPLTLRVLPDRTWAWISGGIGVFLLFGLGWGLLRRKRKTPAESPSGEPGTDRDAVRSLIQSCRKRRVEGAHYEFYVELARAAALVSSESSDLATAIRARAQDIGYRGAQPTEYQMDGDLRSVENALARLDVKEP